MKIIKVITDQLFVVINNYDYVEMKGMTLSFHIGNRKLSIDNPNLTGDDLKLDCVKRERVVNAIAAGTDSVYVIYGVNYRTETVK